MKENIFIEGDLVLHNNNVCKIEGKTLTCDTNLLEFYIVRTPNGCLYSIQPIEVTPIPISPEILEKNGWEIFIEQHDFRYAFKIDDSCYLVVMTGFLDGIRIFIRKENRYSKLRTLKYVSDLQHLFFGLGLSSEMEV